mgnify:CR=1 FL=1
MSTLSPHPILILKRNVEGKETWRYEAIPLEQSSTGILVEAFFNRPDLPFHEIVLRQGDRFLEAYYCDRWYNIFEIHDYQNDQLKAWYCNITLPALINSQTIEYVDLALDLLVYPDGRQFVLDEDEFTALSLSLQQRQQCWDAMRALRHLLAKPAQYQILRDWMKQPSGLQQN